MIRRTEERPDFPGAASDRLDEKERARIAFVRRTFEPGRVDSTIRYLQRTLGSRWIQFFTRNLRHVHGRERLPAFDGSQSYVCVANHRSFFDLYAVTSTLVAEGLPHRIVFPVRANFFYTHPLGLFVNGAMSFFAMYPPVFREIRFCLARSHPLSRRSAVPDSRASTPPDSVPRGCSRCTIISQMTTCAV